MNTKEFLSRIWGDGVHLLGVLVGLPDGRKTIRHKAVATIDEASAFIATAVGDGLNVFHACASYKSRPYRNADGRFVVRTAENWLSAKAFWVDIDCGTVGHQVTGGYDTQEEAVEALNGWCEAREFPRPMIISSGHGIHGYWTMTESLPADEWVKAAKILKATFASDGLRADPARTADFASILRPVGSKNFKDTPLDVTLVQDAQDTDPYVLLASIANMAVADDALGAAPAWLTGEECSPVSPEFPETEVSARLIADKCPQMAKLRDTQGDVSYETWRGLIGIIKYAKEGIELAREWSAKRGDTGHDNTDVDTRYNTWDAGPTLCQTLEQCDGSLCASCPFHGKIKSPIVLGRVVPTTTEQIVEVTDEGDARKAPLKVTVPPLPDGYSYSGGQLVRWVEDKDGKVLAHPFCRNLFYFVGRIRNVEGLYEYVVRLHLPHGNLRTFNLPGGDIGQGGSKLMASLGAREIVLSNSKDACAHMCAYLRDQVGKIMVDKDVMSTYSSYGWQDDGSFLVGTRLYQTDGAVSEVLLSGYADGARAGLPIPKGSLEKYSEALNWVYNRDGMEPMQYVICSMLASPLVSLHDSAYAGIPVAVTGAASGKGKTTACAAALYAFGDATSLTMAGSDGATAKARSAFLGAMSDLPVLFDEVTNMTPSALSQLAYALSNGMEPMRLRSSGGRVQFADRETWHLQAACTGNSYIGARLAANGQTEAEAMRIFEIRVDGSGVPQLDPIEVAQRLNDMSRNMGCAGEKYISWLVTHKTAARKIIRQIQDSVSEDTEFVGNPKYRFFRNHVVLTLACAAILKHLRIVEFDLDRLLDFARKAVRQLCRATEETNAVDYLGALGSMIDFYQGDILKSEVLVKPKGSSPYLFHPKNYLVGRMLESSPTLKDKFDGQLLIASRAVSEWCVANRVDKQAFADFLTGEGVLLRTDAVVRLAAGTVLAGGVATRCWQLDMTKTVFDVTTKEEQNG